MAVRCFFKHTLFSLEVSIISEPAAPFKKSGSGSAAKDAPVTNKAAGDQLPAAASEPVDLTLDDKQAATASPPAAATAVEPAELAEPVNSTALAESAAPQTGEAPFINDFDDPAIPLDVLESPVREHQTLQEWMQQHEEARRLRRLAEQQAQEPPSESPSATADPTAAASPDNPQAAVPPEPTHATESGGAKSTGAAKTAAVAAAETANTTKTAATSATRDFSFDNIRAVLIFLVIFGHALEYFRLTDQVAEFVYVFIYFFHMPVFIFISGYFSKNLQRGRETAVRNFLLPYLLLNLVLSLIMLALGKIDEILILNPGWTLWYLYCMFIWRLLLPDLVRVRHVLAASFVIAVFSGFLTEFGTYMAMARTLGFLPFFLAGYYCRPEHIARIRRLPFRRILSLVIAAVGLLTAGLWLSADLPPEILWGDRAYATIDIPLWQNLLADIYLYALSFAFIFVFITLAKNRRRFYTIWGQNTLAIYLLHVYLVAPLVDLGERLGTLKPASGSWWGIPALQFLFLLGGSVTILWLLSRPIVSRGVAKALDKVTGWVMVKKG